MARNVELHPIAPTASRQPIAELPSAPSSGRDCNGAQATVDEMLGMAWWNNASELTRARWLRIAESAVPADAWYAFKALNAQVGE